MGAPSISSCKAHPRYPLHLCQLRFLAPPCPQPGLPSPTHPLLPAASPTHTPLSRHQPPPRPHCPCSPRIPDVSVLSQLRDNIHGEQTFASVSDRSQCHPAPEGAQRADGLGRQAETRGRAPRATTLLRAPRSCCCSCTCCLPCCPPLPWPAAPGPVPTGSSSWPRCGLGCWNI